MSIITRSFVKANKWQAEQNCLQKWHRVSTPSPPEGCFALCGQLVVCQDPSAGRGAILPRSHDWQKLHRLQSAWNQPQKEKRQKTGKNHSRYFRAWRWNHGQVFLHYSKTTACLKYQKYIKDICYSNQFLTISVVYCSQKRFFKTNADFHNRVESWTGKPDGTPSLCSCCGSFYRCSGPVLLAGEKEKTWLILPFQWQVREPLSWPMPKPPETRGGRDVTPSPAPAPRSNDAALGATRDFHLLKGQTCLGLLLCNHRLTFACSCSRLCTLSWAAICFYAYFIITAIVDLAVWKK